MRDRLLLRNYMLLVLLALLWGGSYPLIKVALETFPPVTLMAFRVAVAAVLLSVAVKLRGHSFPYERTTIAALLVQSFFNSIGAWTLLAWGQQYVDSGLAGVLNSTSPIFVFFLALALRLSPRIEWLKLAGALIGLAGVVVLLDVEGLGRELLPQLAILGGALLYGCAAVYGRRFRDQPAMVTAAGTMIWAALVLTPAAFVLETPLAAEISARSLVAATTLAIGSTALAMLIYFHLIGAIGSLAVASQAYLRSAVAVLLGVGLLGEPMSLSLAAGVGLVLLGMILLNTPASKRSQRETR
ncbi:MAG: EamA family transporter [Pseudomonadota bacterium]